MDPIQLNNNAYLNINTPGDLESRIRAIQAQGPQTDEQKKLMSAAQDFESYFIYMLMKEMRKTVNESPMFHGGNSEKIFTDMLDEELGKDMAKAPGDGMGIAKLLYEQLSRPLIAQQLEQADAASLPASTSNEGERLDIQTLKQNPTTITLPNTDLDLLGPLPNPDIENVIE
jgi:peptidoglycan hydrolase FlgJ